MSPERARRVAAIDLGTNSVRLIVAEAIDRDGRDYRVLAERREQTRLGQQLDETGRIDDAAAHRTLDALARMRTLAEELGVDELRAVGTAALREAANGPEFVRSARERANLDLETIGPLEEADLALRSARRRFPIGEGPAAIVDIGGGSMEVVLARGKSIDQVRSLPLGAVRLTERHVRSEPIEDADWNRLQTGIQAELDSHLGRPPYPTPDLVGSGGTFTALAALVGNARSGEAGRVDDAQGYSMDPSELDRQVRRLRDMSLSERRNLPGLDPERADIIVAGAAAVTALVDRLGVRRISVNDRGIRDGMLLEMLECQGTDL